MINREVKVNTCCIEVLRGLVGTLYTKFGNTPEVLEASQYLDKYISEKQKEELQ